MKKILLSSCVAISLFAGGDISPVVDIVPVITAPVVSQPLYSSAFKFGTLGVGVDFSIPMTESFNMRFNINGFKYSTTTNQNNIDYTATASLLTAGILMDYYPFKSNEFRMSIGTYYNGNSFDFDIGSSTAVTLNGVNYNAGQLSSLNMTTLTNKFAPYIGIGCGEKGHEKGWGLTADVGVLYQGKPVIDATVKNTSTSPATIQADVEAERVKLQDTLSKYSVYPVIMVGASYSF